MNYRVDKACKTSDEERNVSVDISIIIPVYNHADLTLQCLESLLSVLPVELNCEIVIVDNASTDNTRSTVLNFSEKTAVIKYYRNEDNLGFAKACNIGANFAQGKTLVFLNNDTISLNDWIENGYNRLFSSDEIGIVGAKLLYPDTTIQHAGIEFEKREKHYLPIWPTHNYRNSDSNLPEANQLREYHAVTGACLFIKKDLFEEVEGFDETYGMYFEDIDLCFKVNNKNKKIIYDPAVCLIHLEGKSSSNRDDIDDKNIASSKIFYDKWRSQINKLAQKSVSNTVYWLSPIFNPSGYASGAICFSLGLEKYLDLIIRHQNTFLSQDFVDNMPEKWREVIFRLHLVEPREWNTEINFANNPIAIQHQPANAFKRIPDAYCIGRTMYETDRLPQDWVNKCNMMDEIWVPSEFNKKTFGRSGVDENKIFVIPESIDTDVFNPDATKAIELPNKAKFNFLSIFEWTNRKGWDILLKAYFEAFNNKDDVCLYLRTYLLSHYDEDTKTELSNKIDAFIKRNGYRKENLPRFELLTKQLSFKEMLGLYKSVDAFVLPSRGEGWGRPYMEAMAYGLPVIATNWSGNTEFMNNDNSYLIDVHKLVTINENEISSYLGHQWAEPSKSHLIKLFRYVFEHPQEAKFKGASAKIEIENKYGLQSVAELVCNRLKIIEEKYQTNRKCNRENKIAWEGDQFINHSLALVNREISSRLNTSGFQLNLIMPKRDKYDRELIKSNSLLVNLTKKPASSADIHVRHKWPPDLTAPKSGRWVMMQPWEFGSLPKKWVEIFNASADELWVYSEYLRKVYIDSGVSPDRVFRIPLGFSPEKFNPEVNPVKLKTKKKTKFLFVGGTIYRKGIDILLESYANAFKYSDDVCLVIKDVGTNSFYKGQTIKSKIDELKQDNNLPEIEYLDTILNDKQIAGLYTACDVLVHPYRGEGFGLPVLEAMACGLTVIVTDGGSTDDFCNAENSLKIKSQKFYLNENKIDSWETINRPWLLEPDKDDLTQKMLYVYSNKKEVGEIGVKACRYVHEHWSWDKTVEVIQQRISDLSKKPILRFVNKTVITSLSNLRVEPHKYLTEAYSLYYSQDYIGSLNKLEKVIKNLKLDNENNLDTILADSIFCLAGLANLGLNNLDPAKKYFEEALRLNPVSSNACYGLGQLFFQQKQFEPAKIMFEWAVKNDLTNQNARQALNAVNTILLLPKNHNNLEEQESNSLSINTANE